MFDDSPTTLTRRTIALLAMAVLAAMPLVWFSVDADAGSKMLKWSNGWNQSHLASRGGVVNAKGESKSGNSGIEASSSPAQPKSLIMRIRDTAI
jgi:hypothetical protein